MGGLLSSPGACDMDGSCECGRVKVKLTEKPIVTFKCHCTRCYNFQSMKPSSRVPCNPTVGIFRNGAVKITGADSIGYQKTRGAFPFGMGLARGFCQECKTPGVIETIRDTIFWFLLGGLSFVWIGCTHKDSQSISEDFNFHMCYDTATATSKQAHENDGKPKLGAITGVLAVVATVYFPPTRALFVNQKQNVKNNKSD